MHLLLNIFKPELIFFLGIGQALTPYFFWFLFGVNENYSQEITGQPILIWLVGYMVFILGAKFAKRSFKSHHVESIFNRRRIIFFLKVTIFVWCCVLIPVIQAYGGVPLLKFIFGSMDVGAVNQLQASSFPGLFGVWFTVNNLLISIVSVAILMCVSNHENFPRYLVMGIIFIIFGAILGGKRQGLFIAGGVMFSFVFIAIGNHFQLSLAKNILKKSIVIFYFFIMALILISAFIATIRVVDNSESGFVSLYRYLDYPLINMEWQIDNFGLIAGADNIFPLVAGFIPYKLISGSGYGLENTELIFDFFYPEPGIGAGYFGPAHLAFGMIGVIVFGFITGYFSRKIYNLAIVDIRWVLPYCTFIWPLFSAHSYTHFLSFLFFVVPFIASCLISRYCFNTKLGLRNVK